MKIKHAMLALAIAAMATSASAFEFHGYFRSGLGGSNKDGKQTCFYLPQLDHKFRLGNECETYGELDFQESLYKDKNGVEFKGEFMLAYKSSGDASYESLAIPGTVVSYTSGNPNGNATYVATGNSNDIALRQAWAGAKLPQLGGATIWAGNRYYHRQDIHILDWYYWDPSGPGAGIEDIDVGIGKFAFAVFQSGTGTGAQGLSTSSLGVYPNLADFLSSTSHGVLQRVFWRPDIRLYGIPMPFGGSLEIGADLAIDSANTQFYTRSGDKLSAMGTLQWLQPNLLGGFNKLILQAGEGALAPLSSYPQANNDSDSYQLRAIDFLVIQPVPEFSAGIVLSIAKVQHLYGPGTTGDFNSNINYQAGIRPVFHVNDYFKVQGEFGYQVVHPTDDNADGVAGDRSLFKATIAPTLVAGGGFWSRPEIRLFATYAAWNDAARVRNVTGGTFVGEWTGGSWTQGSYGNPGPFGADNYGLTFGAQVEAWW